MTDGRHLDDRHPSAGIRVSDWRRLYAWQHPLAVSLSIGAVGTALGLALFPAVLAESAIGTLLPVGLEYAWLATWGVGGALSLAGYWRLDAHLEAPGLVLQATAYLVYAVALCNQRPAAAVLGITVASLNAVGMGARALVILTRPEVNPWEQRRS